MRYLPRDLPHWRGEQHRSTAAAAAAFVSATILVLGGLPIAPMGSTMEHVAKTQPMQVALGPYSSCQATALSTPQAAAEPTSAEQALSFTRAWPLATGTGVRIAVIDTGISTHPRLGEIIDGGDFTDGAGAFMDCEAHGTFVASLIAAKRGNDWVAGVAPNSELISVRHTAVDMGDLRSLAEGMDAAREAGARIINVSLAACVAGNSIPDGAADITAAVHRAEEAGIVIVAAAGNSGADCEAGSTAWPAVLPEVVAVSAVAHDDLGQPVPAEYAITGPWVDISAPGGPVVGLNPRSDSEFADRYVNSQGDAQIIQGTSFAAPLVSGTAALIAEQHPDFSAAQIRHLLIATASPISPNLGLGTGIVAPFNAVTWRFGDAQADAVLAPPPPPPSLEPQSAVKDPMPPQLAAPAHQPEPTQVPAQRLGVLAAVALIVGVLALLLRLGRQR